MAHPDDLIDIEPVGDPLPLDYGPAGLQRRTCWYCGGREGPFETEHQLPVSRGGRWGANIVDSCASCNHLKGRLTVDEFRRALAVRLGVTEVVFAGEAGEGRPATPITSVRSLGADREVVLVDPLAGDRLSRAVRLLRTMGWPSFAAMDAVTDAIHRWCDELAAKYLKPGEDFPADGGAPSLFGENGGEQGAILQPGELSSTPKVPQSRDVTRISGPVLERARAAVAVLRQREDPDLLLMGFVDAAASRLVDEVEERYPELSRHAEGLPETWPPRTDFLLPSNSKCRCPSLGCTGMTLYDTDISNTVTCDVCSKEHPRAVTCSFCGREKLADPHGTLGWPSNAQLIDGDYEGPGQWTCQDREACDEAYAARVLEERQPSKPRVMLQLIHSARAALKADYDPEYAAETLGELEEFIKTGKGPWERERGRVKLCFR